MVCLSLCLFVFFMTNRVFLKVDHSVNIARIVLIDLLLIKFFLKNLPKIWQKISQGFGKIILKIWDIFIKYLAKFYLTINDSLPVLQWQ